MSYTLVCFWNSGSLEAGSDAKANRMVFGLRKHWLLFLRTGEKVEVKTLRSMNYVNDAN